jgi:hypothetical protein
MDRDVAGGVLIEISAVDIASLLEVAADSGLKTGLDRALASSASACSGFDNCIDSH